jgi:primosomal protein N' (replication factor Y)
MTRTADLVFPLPLSQAFTYRVPDSLAERARRGSRATAPLGKKTLTGFIVAVRSETPAERRALKDLLDVLDEEPAFTERLLGFTEALSRYYHASWGMVLQAALPPSRVPRRKARVRLTDAGREALAGGRLGPKEKAIAGLLAAGNYTPLYLARRAKVREVGPLLGRLAKKGYVLVGEEEARPVRRRERRAVRELRQLEFGFPGVSRGAAAAARVEKVLAEGRFAPFYLYGGRAAREEVTLRLLRQVVSGGGKALFLVPEISLTESRAERIARHLGRDLVRLHSRLSPRDREEAWDSLRRGRAAAALGPRSALFAPLEPLRLLIVDEEQDESHVQTDNPVLCRHHLESLAGEAVG